MKKMIMNVLKAKVMVKVFLPIYHVRCSRVPLPHHNNAA